MKQPSRQNHRNNRNNKGGRRPSGGGGGTHSANRVYDSAGPEGKVRGTAQQIIDKYTSMARDAQTSGEGVLAENFFQHAEHYQRILTTIQAAEAEERERRQAAQQAEQERRAEQQARQQQQRAENQPSETTNRDQESLQAQNQPTQNVERRDAPELPAPTANEDMKAAEPAAAKTVATAPLVEHSTEGPALVETPEAKLAEQRDTVTRPARRPRSKPAPKVDGETGEKTEADLAPQVAAQSDAEVETPPKPKRGRPRKAPAAPASEEADRP